LVWYATIYVGARAFARMRGTHMAVEWMDGTA
jgi:hypothetical protein